jgi:hypothetical protein
MGDPFDAMFAKKFIQGCAALLARFGIDGARGAR